MKYFIFLLESINLLSMSAYNDFIYLLGDLFTETFEILPALGNIPNYLYAVIMAAGTVYWLKWQIDLNKEAKENGTLE